MQIRLLHLVDRLTTGGTEKAAATYVKYSNRSVFDSRLGGLNAGGALEAELRDRGIPYELFDSDISELERYIRAESINVVHIHSGLYKGLETAVAAKRAGADFIFHTNSFGWIEPADLRGLFDRTFFVSCFSLRRYVQYWGGDWSRTRNRCYVTHVPVETDVYKRSSGARSQVRSRLGIDDATILYGRLGRPDPRKIGFFLTRAFRQLPLHSPDWKLLVIGGLPANLRRSYSVRELGGRIIEIPSPLRESEIVEYLSALDVMAHSSRVGESFGLAVAEGMACSLPIVAQLSVFGDNALPELVDDGGCGFLEYGVNEFADSLLRLGQAPHQIEQFGSQSRKNCVARFGAFDVVRRYEAVILYDLYPSLIAELAEGYSSYYAKIRQTSSDALSYQRQSNELRRAKITSRSISKRLRITLSADSVYSLVRSERRHLTSEFRRYLAPSPTTAGTS